ARGAEEAAHAMIEVPEQVDARQGLAHAAALLVVGVDADAEEGEVAIVEQLTPAEDFFEQSAARRRARGAEEAEHDVAAGDRVELEVGVDGRAHLEARDRPAILQRNWLARHGSLEGASPRASLLA